MTTPKQLTLALTTMLLTLTLATPSLAENKELATDVSLLVGRPGEDLGNHGSLVVPGTVIPAWSDTRLDAALSSGGGEEAARRLVRNTRLEQVADSLKENLRLSEIEVRYQVRHTLPVDGFRELPPPTGRSDVRLRLELLGFNAETATYRVQFFEGTKTIADTPLTVHRGKQAVVGGLDGEEAPYLFLVIAPDAQAGGEAKTAAGPLKINEDIQPPLPIVKIPPSYTEEARQEKLQGVVVLQAVIETDGTVSEVEVLQGLPLGLTQSAVDTIRQWRFEPALQDGVPVRVYYNLTVNFRLKPKGAKQDTQDAKQDSKDAAQAP